MPTPDKPSLDYSYTAFQESQGNNAFPGTQLDNDLANLKLSIDETIDFASGAIREDGKLQNGIVTKNSLAEDVLLGVPAPRPWLTATDYAVDQTATINNSLYICQAAHTSGVFATDLAVGRWALLIEFTVPAAILDGSVTEPKHATGGVSTRALANNSVTTVKVPDGAMTKPKLAPAVQQALLPIGASMDWDGPFAPAGWVFKFGQALSRVTYPDLLAVLCPAIIGNVENGSQTISGLTVDLRNLGLEGSKIEGAGIPTGTTVASVTATTLVLSVNATVSTAGAQVRLFPHGNGDGSSTFNVPDDRDVVSVGRGNMGGTAAGKITNTGNGNPGVDTKLLGRFGGVDRHALTAVQLPANIPNSAVSSTTVSAPGGFAIMLNAAGNFTAYSSGAAQTPNAGNLVTALPASTGTTVTINPSGGQEHPNVQPMRLTNKIIFTGVV